MSGFGDMLKNTCSLTKLLLVGRCEMKSIGGEFHLTKMNDTIGTGYDKVYLRTNLVVGLVGIESPCGSRSGHTRNAESFLDLRKMQQMQNFGTKIVVFFQNLKK